MSSETVSNTCTNAINSLQQALAQQLASFNSLNAACSTACDPAQSNVACTAECSSGLKDLETACHDAAAHVYQEQFRTTCSGAGAGIRMTYTYQCLPSACSAADVAEIASQLNASSCSDALQVPWVTSCAVSLAQDDAYGNSGTGAMIAGIIGGILGTALLVYITWFLCRHYRSGRGLGFGADSNEHLPMLGPGGRKFGPGGASSSAAANGAGSVQSSHAGGFSSGGAAGYSAGGAGGTSGSSPMPQSNYQRRLQVYKGGPPPGQAALGSSSAAAPAIIGTPLQPLRIGGSAGQGDSAAAPVSSAVSTLLASSSSDPAPGAVVIAVAASSAGSVSRGTGPGAMPVPVTPYIESGSDAYPLPDGSVADNDGASEAGSSVALGFGHSHAFAKGHRGPGRASGSGIPSPSAGGSASATGAGVPPAVRPAVTKLNATHGGLGKALKPSEYRQLTSAASRNGAAGGAAGGGSSGASGEASGSDLDALSKLGTTIKARIGLPASPVPGLGSSGSAVAANDDGGPASGLRASLIADSHL